MSEEMTWPNAGETEAGGAVVFVVLHSIGNSSCLPRLSREHGLYLETSKVSLRWETVPPDAALRSQSTARQWAGSGSGWMPSAVPSVEPAKVPSSCSPCCRITRGSKRVLNCLSTFPRGV